MKIRNIALAGILAITLLGVSAVPQLAIAPVYAEEASAASDQSEQAFASLVEGSAEKAEVVYASMSATGTLRDLYVVNELFVETPAMVKDYGAYSDILNLTDEAQLAKEPDSVVCMIAGESFVYQGNLASAELPWTIHLSYKLDGNSISPEDLAGRSGALELSIETDRNPAADQLYYENYMLQITCTLPIEHATKIETDQGQIALAGSDTTVTFSCLPGKSGSYSLTAQVKDFEMEGISIAAIPFSMVIDMPDSEALVSQFDALIEGAGQLSSGASALSEATSTLNDGAQALDQGADQVQAGAEQLSSGLGAYVAGITRLGQGLAQAAAGSNAFAKKLTELSRTSEDVSLSLDAIEAHVRSLAAQIQASSLPDAEKAALLQQITGLSSQIEGLKSYVTGVGSLSGAYAELDSSITQLSSGANELIAQGDQLIEGSTKLDAGIDELAGGAGEIGKGSSQLASGVESLSAGAAQLHAESQLIPDKVRAEIDAFASDYDKSDFEPVSFVDARNTNVTLVQFVMSTEAIHVPVVETEEPEDEDETLLSRFFALFS